MSLDHIFHVWINRRQQENGTHESHLYSFKGMVQLLFWAPNKLKEAFERKLPTVHQQCSHSPPEPIQNNRLRCWLGKDVTECPILASVKAVWDEHMEKPFYAERNKPDGLYQIMGQVCAWHLFMSDVSHAIECEKPHVRRGKEEPGPSACLPEPAYIDWNEGAMQDESDRMFWDRVYTNLTDNGEEPE